MDAFTVPVNTRPAYRVHIGPGLLAECGNILRDVWSPRRLAIVTDSHVAPLYAANVAERLRAAGFGVSVYAFPAGEANKNLDGLSGILEFLAAEGFTRSDALVALGGGVTGDMAGFAAAVYLRGVPYAQMPTTLLSAVDSSVGGKTAVDLRAGKNLAGAFLQPSAVVCDTDCLATLPPDVFADGAAEAIKTGVLCDESLFAMFEDGNLTACPAEAIARCVEYKAGVVERDEREQGERRLLNLGHTVGHAIELLSGYAIPHGHAVAAGLGVIARASDALGWTETPIADRVCRCLEANRLPSGTDFAPDKLSKAALSDKKRAGGAITLAVPKRIGRGELKTVPIEDLPRIIRAGLDNAPKNAQAGVADAPRNAGV